MDFYGGFKKTFGDWPRRRRHLLLLPGQQDDPAASKINNTEVYIGGSWGPCALKYSHAFTDFFGVADTKGS